MKNEKKNKLLLFSTISIISILLIGGLIYFFLISGTGQSTIQTKRDGISLQASFYNSNGKPINGRTQTAVGGESGLFYMSFKVKASNIGTAPLTNLRIQESHPTQMTEALQSAPAIKTNLSVGESNILEWDTANLCSTDANCGASEKCVNIDQTIKKCLIDISNFIGEYTFGLTIQADFLDALGQNLQTTSKLLNIPITFEQDSVIFRTNDLTYSSGWIAVDINNDGNLEGFGYSSSTSRTYDSSDFLAFTPQGYGVYKYSAQYPNTVHVTNFVVSNKDVNQNGAGKVYASSLGGNAILLKTPTEPYKSQNCGGIANVLCQERYSIAVAPPSQTCGNNIIEGTELCDGTDLGGDDCITINQGFTGGTLACSSCTSWETSQCTTPPVGDYITLRTTDLGYSSGSSIAYKDTCDGSDLSKYSYIGSTSSTGANCGACPYTSKGSFIMDGLKTTSTSAELWSYNSYTTDQRLIVCLYDSAQGKCFFKRYASDSGATVNPAGTTIDTTKEVFC